MFASIVTSVIAYISTNLDDIFVLTLLLAQAGRAAGGRLIAGHFLGVGCIVALSMLGALGLQGLPLNYVGLLGLVPIAMGIRAWMEGGVDSAPEKQAVGTLGMAMITLGNGGDNLGVYIPLFTGFSSPQRVAAAAVFTVMTVLWVWLADALAKFRIGSAAAKHKRVLIPVVFIGLGVYILLDSGLLG